MNVIYDDWSRFKYEIDYAIDMSYGDSTISCIELSPAEWHRAKLHLGCAADVGPERLWYRGVLLVPAWRVVVQ